MIFKDTFVVCGKNIAKTTFIYLYVGALAVHGERGGKVVESDEKVERLLSLARAGRMSLLRLVVELESFLDPSWDHKVHYV